MTQPLDPEAEQYMYEAEAEAEAFRKFQEEQQASFEISSTQIEEIDATEEESQELINSSSIRKVPFRGFKARSQHSINLLNAILLKPPFGIENGSTVPERWQAVVNILKETGSKNAVGGKNEYEHVIPRTCQLAWNKFRQDHNDHVRAQERLTGAVENEDHWTNLLRVVVELEEAELVKKKASSSSSKKTSAELEEQKNKQGAALVSAAMSHMKRRRESSSDTDTSDTSGSSNIRQRSRQTVRSEFKDFIQMAREKIEESTSTQKVRDELLTTTFNNFEAATSRQAETIASTIAATINQVTEKQTSSLATAVASAMETAAKVHAEAVEAAANRQASAMEALAAALMSRK